jgi:hypothetical protein
MTVDASRERQRRARPGEIEVENSVEVINLTLRAAAARRMLTLLITKPKGGAGGPAVPCIYTTHGGGMAVGHTWDVAYRYTCDALA